MRDYGKVYTAFWTSDDTRSMSEDARILALYLLTCNHGNMLGCYRIPSAYAAEDLKWDSERVSKGFDELLEKGFAYRCGRSFWVFIREYLKWNQFENPNVGTAAGKLFDSLSAPSGVKSLLAKALREYSPRFPSAKLDKFEEESEPFANPFETVSKTVVGAVAVVGAPAKPEVTATKTVAAPQKKEPSKNIETWEAYANSYFNRYGTEPVRNASVNAKIAQFVDRLGVEESPHVARFFVGHNNGYYVREMHAVGAMLKDAEKLRTEWATNTQMTGTKALQADKTQTNVDAFGPLIAAQQALEAGTQ